MAERALERLVLASGNAGKLAELRALLAPHRVECLGQRALGIADADEPHVTFVENALAKARYASRAAGLPALADDSGLCVPALGGAPGVRSARYAADAGHGAGDAANNAHLVAQLAARGVPDGAPGRAGYYVCVVVLVRAPDDPCPVVADATWHGEVIDRPRGHAGFGYDPHFLLPQHGLTVAELPAERKNALSHRGRAMAGLLQRLREAGLLGAPEGEPHALGTAGR